MKYLLIVLASFSVLSLSASEDDFTDEERLRICKKIQEITINSQKEWPDNYRMQIWYIEQQYERMIEMERFCKKICIKPVK